MTVDIDVPALYRRAAINVWVEDQVSKAYLATVWNDASVQFLVAGGTEGVSALTRQAEANQYRNVFGVVDRDFGETNHGDWQHPNKQFLRFVLPVFELENYLLDAAGLTACEVNSSSKSAAEIRERMQRRAGELVSWMSCRSVLSELRRTVLDDFPTHPSNSSVVDADSAVAAVVGSLWFAQIQRRTATITEPEVREKIGAAQLRYQHDLTADKWTTTFSGKEIFRDVSSYIYAAPSHGTERDVDVARKLAQHQLSTNTVPPTISELLAAMKLRIGL